MKKLFVLILTILTIIISGCTPAMFDMNSFVMPDDIEFMQTVEILDTPEKIGNYMENNFEYQMNLFYTLNPYMLFKTKKGDCSDFAKFGMFIANFHGYETFLTKIYFKGSIYYHEIAIYKEDGKYNFSSNNIYFPVNRNSLRECIRMYFYYYNQKGLKWYEIYDYSSNYLMGGN